MISVHISSVDGVVALVNQGALSSSIITRRFINTLTVQIRSGTTRTKSDNLSLRLF